MVEASSVAAVAGSSRLLVDIPRKKLRAPPKRLKIDKRELNTWLLRQYHLKIGS
jgi:hypothetical protein